MILTDFKIHHLRNISSAHLVLNSRFTFIIGPNGSGKTSILEALYLLSCGHSFRSREISPIITHGQSALTVFARAANHDTVSIQKSCCEPTQIKLNNQFCTTTSQLAYALPCQIFYSDIFQIIDAGPSVRRSVLDWGLFHVKPNYLALWKEYKKVLKHRNALLKKHAPYAYFIPWDQQLSCLANQLDELRQDYFELWKNRFYHVLQQLTDSVCSIDYFKGWDKKKTGKSLEQVLAEHFNSDNQKLYTQYGAHQADIFIESNDIKAKQVLSRGQQKIILIALKLAQGELLNQQCLYLFDDLVSELDDDHQHKLLDYLASQPGQYVITSVNKMDFIAQLPNEHVSSYAIHNGSIVANTPE
ncbi:DNA replication/repair protein RecF [Legionella maioricensis]|uniref:DNA replication and repair protein RecF n=1 Tax=Legionella maioricensis TaxID=2896528 RepID=A0A9X2IBX1_9GAMM|nr:DNA replication/repair protein RecF [Legionella maioricensis]MCL9683123.1 DNA replication/repair protein RecF [Legionella maioricensis]MCL9688022.1 DNA replication/repair protein RecF [Legionella maioricensis]